MSQRVIRQGDVWLIELTNDERECLSGLRRALRVERGPQEGIIVAAGEATGHHHRVRTNGATLYDLRRRPQGRNRYIASEARNKIGADRVLHSPKGGATITHEEHAPLEIPEGDYKVVIAREYFPQEAPRRVYD